VHDGVWNGTQLCLKVNQLMVAKDQEGRVCKEGLAIIRPG